MVSNGQHLPAFSYVIDNTIYNECLTEFPFFFVVDFVNEFDDKKIAMQILC